MRYLLIANFVCAALAGFAQPLLKKTENSSVISTAGVIEAGNGSPNIFKRSRITKCTDEQNEFITKAIEECYKWAWKASQVVATDDTTRIEYFKTGNSHLIWKLTETYQEIGKACKITEKEPEEGVAFECHPEEGICETSGAYTNPSEETVFLCPHFFLYDTGAAARTLIHELSHLSCIRGTDDHAYGDAASVALNEEKSLDNADNFAWFAYHVGQPLPST